MSYLRKYKHWTEADDVALIKLIRAKQTGVEHWCEVFNASRSCVNDRVKHLRAAGLLDKKKDVKSWTDEEIEKLKKMYKAGLGYAEISKKLGRTKVAAQVRYSRLVTGMPPSGKSNKHSKPAPEPIKPPAEVTVIAPVHYMNVRAGQCRHFVNGGLMCGHVAQRNDRCGQHA